MAFKVLILFPLILNFCNPKGSVEQLSDNPALTTSDSITRLNPLLGGWTDGYTDNATFWIDIDSIHFVEHFNAYKYTLYKDSIEINYNDFIYRGSVLFHKDTLIFSSKGDISRYWPFNN